MNRNTPFFLCVFAIVFFYCVNGFSQKKDEQPKKEREPVSVTASEIEVQSTGKSTITLTLKIQPGIAIYANEPHDPKTDTDYLIPTTIELLDQTGKAIDADLRFPRGILVKSIGGDYRVYSQVVKVIATFPADRDAKKLSLKYQGYRFASSVGDGYS